jgi:hypothetical protein
MLKPIKNNIVELIKVKNGANGTIVLGNITEFKNQFLCVLNICCLRLLV